MREHPIRIIVVCMLLLLLVVVSFSPESVLDSVGIGDIVAKLAGEKLPDTAEQTKRVVEGRTAERLADLRKNHLLPAIGRLMDREPSPDVCDFSHCEGSDNPLCRVAPQLSPEQRKYCADYFNKYLAEYRKKIDEGTIATQAVDEVFAGGAIARTPAASGGNLEFSVPTVEKARVRRMELLAHMARGFWKKPFDPFVGFHLEDNKDVPKFGRSNDLLWALALVVAFEADRTDNLGPLLGKGWQTRAGNFSLLDYDSAYASDDSIAVNAERAIPRVLEAWVEIKLGNANGDAGGLVWVAEDGSHYYAKYWYDFGLYKVILQRVDPTGAETVLKESKSVPGPAGTLRMRLGAKNIEVRLGEELVVRADDDKLTGNGFAGIRGKRASFERFWVEIGH